MAMEFSTAITGFDTGFSNLNAINDYNKYLQGNASFEFETDAAAFSKALEESIKAEEVKPIRDKNGMGSFMDKLSAGLGGGLNSVNTMKLQADAMQEDLAMGGPTSIHDAMIAAEKADLSMKMAIQVRNRILDAYTQITSMSV